MSLSINADVSFEHLSDKFIDLHSLVSRGSAVGVRGFIVWPYGCANVYGLFVANSVGACLQSQFINRSGSRRDGKTALLCR